MEPQNIDKIISQQLLLARLESHLTLDELEAQTNLSSQRLHRYETGLMRIPSHHLVKICKALTIEVSSLFPELVSERPDPSIISLLQQKVIGKLMNCGDRAILKRIDILLSNQ